MNLTVVIPTKNEELNIGNCLDALPGVETIVVDNSSSDRTREIAAAKGARVVVQGPERCAQRNRGWREASGEWVLFLDADMIVTPELLAEIKSTIASDENRPPLSTSTSSLHLVPIDAYWIPEVRTGSGLRLAARNFERSFYNGTVIDGFRLLRRSALERVGGYDENLVACEDWDLDRRLLAAGAKGAILKAHLLHNEAQQTLSTLLKKKAYYSTSVDRYRAKWNNDAICRKQFGIGYRFFGVFFANGGWKRLLRHPILATVMYFERFLVAATYLFNR